MPDWLPAAYVGIGALGGLCAGLFGIGGGAVFGPLLLLLAAERGIPAAQAVPAAVATSIATVILTSIPSALVHSLQRTVDWRRLKLLAPAAVIGAVAGAALIEKLDPAVPALLMLVLLIAGIRSLWTGAAGSAPAAAGAGSGLLAATGGAAGFLGALTGTGGGLIAVPMLVRMGVTIRIAIGTSAVVTMLVAAGASGVLAGRGVDGQALAGVAVGCIVCAAIGARLAARLAAGFVRRLFCILLIAVSLRLGHWLLLTLTGPGGG